MRSRPRFSVSRAAEVDGPPPDRTAALSRHERRAAAPAVPARAAGSGTAEPAPRQGLGLRPDLAQHVPTPRAVPVTLPSIQPVRFSCRVPVDRPEAPVSMWLPNRAPGAASVPPELAPIRLLRRPDRSRRRPPHHLLGRHGRHRAGDLGPEIHFPVVSHPIASLAAHPLPTLAAQQSTLAPSAPSCHWLVPGLHSAPFDGGGELHRMPGADQPVGHRGAGRRIDGQVHGFLKGRSRVHVLRRVRSRPA